LDKKQYLTEIKQQEELISSFDMKQSAEKDCLRELSAEEIISVAGGKFQCTAGGGKITCTW
jgi:hypothetical protein